MPDDLDLPESIQRTSDGSLILKDGNTTDDDRLDRVRQFDPRSRNFPLEAVFEAKQYKPRSYSWDIPKVLDQGAEGACVGFAWAHELLARPRKIEAIDNAFARWIYKVAQKYDAWPGETYSGTSVIAGAKVVSKRPPAMPEGRGLMKEYRWIFGDMDEVIKTLGYFGPVIFGLDWYEGMFDPDEKGFLHVNGALAGGHAILGKGVSIAKRAVVFHNSWGPEWGGRGGLKPGEAYISVDDLQRLLNQQGECCVPVGRLSWG
jgi:hypothetical protein